MVNFKKNILATSAKEAVAVEQVSNYLICKLEKVTPLKLQKMLYYSCALYYTLRNKKFLDTEIKFEAWVHGPVNSILYSTYKDSARMNELIVCEKSMDFSRLNIKEKEFLDNIVQTLGDYSGPVLENLSHREDPWINARKGYSEFQPSNVLISYNDMKNYYKDKVTEDA